MAAANAQCWNVPRAALLTRGEKLFRIRAPAMIEYQLTSAKVCQEPSLRFFYLQLYIEFLIIGKRNGARLKEVISHTAENDITGILFLALADTDMGSNVFTAFPCGTEKINVKTIFFLR